MSRREFTHLEKRKKKVSLSIEKKRGGRVNDFKSGVGGEKTRSCRRKKGVKKGRKRREAPCPSHSLRGGRPSYRHPYPHLREGKKGGTWMGGRGGKSFR